MLSGKVLLLDIECCGDHKDAYIPALGVVVGDMDTGKVLEQRLFKFTQAPDQVGLEPQCKAEFWDKQGDLWERLTTGDDVLPYQTGWKIFYDYVQSLYVKYPKMELLGDNTEFDFGRCNACIYRYAGATKPLRYQEFPPEEGKKRGYHSMTHITDQMDIIKVILPGPYAEIKKRFLPHTHDPVQDCLALFRKALLLQEVLIAHCIDTYVKPPKP